MQPGSIPGGAAPNKHPTTSTRHQPVVCRWWIRRHWWGFEGGFLTEMSEGDRFPVHAQAGPRQICRGRGLARNHETRVTRD